MNGEAPRCTDCGGIMRRTIKGKPNPYDRCSTCRPHPKNGDREYHRRRYWEAKGLDPEQAAALKPGFQAAAEGLVVAVRLGHDIIELIQDTEPDTWIGECAACHRFLVVDLEESPRAYGLTDYPCPGEPIVLVPERRNEYDLEAASTSAANEYRDLEPEYLLGDERTR